MNERWLTRAKLFERPIGAGPVLLCAKGLHNVYQSGLRTTKQTIKGRTYTNSQCRLCANEASRRSRQKRMAA